MRKPLNISSVQPNAMRRTKNALFTYFAGLVEK